MIEKYYRWKAKRRLVNQYRYLQQVNILLEVYLTKRVLAGGSAEFLTKSRQELVSKQNEIKENGKFVNFLLNEKV